MTPSDSFFRKELVNELRVVANLMKTEKNIEKKIYFFSAAYGITSRTFRYSFSSDYLLADLILHAAYQSLFDRFQRIRSGESTISLDEGIFQNIEEGLQLLANAFDNKGNIQEPLEMVLTASFVACGPGNYLREKGLIKL